MTQYTYEYAPYSGQHGTEIPAFEIFNGAGVKVAETNEHFLISQQEEVTARCAMPQGCWKCLKWRRAVSGSTTS